MIEATIQEVSTPAIQGVVNTTLPYRLSNGQVVDENTTTVPLKYLQTKENPRTVFDYDSNDGFDQSIKEHGVQTPVLIAVDEESDLIVFVGGRRTRSARTQLGENYNMPVRFMRLNLTQRRAAALIENYHRENPSLTEEGNHASKLLGALGNNRDATAKYLGWTRSKLDTRLAILALIDIAQVALNSRQISLGIAELLATLPKEKQAAVLAIIQ
ncbi:ParB/RepB/Spo0J family partition protein [Undibacterium sp. Di27W]|uniref:ParB/RepB/Spo0J family partition protein n=1 Tax=Undibacterium sp. Di27W TaxID=3413036 RepID=UPI003BEF86C9